MCVRERQGEGQGVTGNRATRGEREGENWCNVFIHLPSVDFCVSVCFSLDILAFTQNHFSLPLSVCPSVCLCVSVGNGECLLLHVRACVGMICM